MEFLKNIKDNVVDAIEDRRLIKECVAQFHKDFSVVPAFSLEQFCESYSRYSVVRYDNFPLAKILRSAVDLCTWQIDEIRNAPESIFVREDLHKKLRSKSDSRRRAAYHELLEELPSRMYIPLSFVDEGVNGLCDLTSLKGITATYEENFFTWRDREVLPISEAIEKHCVNLEKCLAGTFSSQRHLEALLLRLVELPATLDQISNSNRATLVELTRILNEACESRGFSDGTGSQKSTGNQLSRIDRIEKIIDAYNEKISKAKTDDGLDEEARKRKIEALQHLMERDVDALGNSE